VLDVIDEEDLCTRSAHLGHHLVEVLNKAKEHCPYIADIRAQGSMVAVEFNDPQTGSLRRNLPARCRSVHCRKVCCF
jgi:4-aminobutyrate aminotransferase